MGKPRNRQTGIRAVPRPDRVRVLERATRITAQVYAGQARCIEAVTRLERCAGLLGIKAEPIPAAVAVQGPAGACVLGAAAEDVIPVLPGGVVARSRSWDGWDGAGHVFLHTPQDNRLLDPTINQTSARTGLPTGALIMTVTTADLDDDLTFETDGGVKILYRVVRSDTSWRAGYNGEYAKAGPESIELTRRALELEGFDENLV
jgi:hypothetical protein